MSWANIYFGDNLQSKSGMQNTNDILKNKKYVAVYFSAHWCPPCRAFTPYLAEFYDMLKDEDENCLEVIFASKDEDQATFDESFSDMPWKAIPFENVSFAQELSQRYSHNGIPTLIVLSMIDGTVRDMDGRTTVTAAQGNIDFVMTKWDKMQRDEGKDMGDGKDDDDDDDDRRMASRYK